MSSCSCATPLGVPAAGTPLRKVTSTPETPLMSTGSGWLTLVEPGGITLVRYCDSWSSATGVDAVRATTTPWSGAVRIMSTVPAPLAAARALGLVVSSCHPGGMLVRNPVPANGDGATVGVDPADVLELGVTVAVVPPHALSSRIAAQAPNAWACVEGEGTVTSRRIAERSRLSRCRCEENPTHGNELSPPCHAARTGRCTSARLAHRPRAGHQRLPAQRASARFRGRRLVGRIRRRRAHLGGARLVAGGAVHPRSRRRTPARTGAHRQRAATHGRGPQIVRHGSAQRVSTASPRAGAARSTTADGPRSWRSHRRALRRGPSLHTE